MEAPLKNIPTIDGHHHIWRLKDRTDSDLIMYWMGAKASVSL
jgi:hypothetical protein